MKPLRPQDPAVMGPFELEGLLGSGGTGTVYLGRSPGGRPAAVKVLNEFRDWDPQVVDRFQREAETLRQVHSAYSATLIACGPAHPPFWMATEYIPGPTLAAVISRDGLIPAAECLRLTAALAEGLGDIHAHGICHRDVKPQNIILSPTGPRLIDFGIARGPAQSRLTEFGITVGTPNYTAPELLDDEELTPAADIFGLGATMAYAATGREPYGTGTVESIFKRVFVEEIDLAGVEPQLAALLRACVARDPQRRPPVSQVIEQCRRGPAATRPAPAEAPRRPSREKKAVAATPSGDRLMHDADRMVPIPAPAVTGSDAPAARRRPLIWALVAAAGLLMAAGAITTQRYHGTGQSAARTAVVFPAASRSAGSPPPTAPGVPEPQAAKASLSSKLALSRTTPPSSPKTSSKAAPRPSAPAKTSRAVVATTPRTGRIVDGTNRCADNNSSVTNDNNRLQLVPCNGTSAQRWTVRTDDRLEVQGKCMTIAGNATAHGSRVVLVTCGSTRAQIWRSRTDGTLRNPASGRCLDVLAESDTALILQDCVGRPTQQWRLP